MDIKPTFAFRYRVFDFNTMIKIIAGFGMPIKLLGNNSGKVNDYVGGAGSYLPFINF